MALKKPVSITQKIDKLESKLDQFIDFVTIQFQKVEQRFESIDKRFEKVDERFERVDERLGKLEDGQEKMFNHLDHIYGELKSMRQENTVAAHRSHRIENWVIKASKKINLPYHP